MSCVSCGAGYEIREGVPVLTPPLDTHKRLQADSHDDHVDPDGEIERPLQFGPFFQRLMAKKIEFSLVGLPPIEGLTALCVCAGSGYDAEQLAYRGAQVISTDVSLGASLRAAERARRHGFDMTVVAADAECLPFADRSIDLVYVHDGLHHLADPFVGIAEMCRVARLYVSINEPAASPVTSAAVRIGLAEQVEDAGNVVARLEPESIASALATHGFQVTHSTKYAMFYRHEPGIVSRGLDPVAGAAMSAFGLLQPLLRSVGNKLSVKAVRSE